MKNKERKTIIETLQQNLKLMQEEAQLFKQKHQNNLPSLCSPRHYLFQTIKQKNDCDAISQPLPLLKSTINNKETLASIDETKKSEAKTAIYNLEFHKRLNAFEHCSKKNKLATSRSAKLKATSESRIGKILNNPEKTEVSPEEKKENKMKTILMNSRVLEIANNNNLKFCHSYSPKRIKEEVSRKELLELKKEIERYYYSKREENKTELNRYKSKSTFEKDYMHTIEQEQEQCHTENINLNIANLKKRESYSIKKLHKKSLQKKDHTKRSLEISNNIEKIEFLYDECSPWKSNDLCDENTTCYFK